MEYNRIEKLGKLFTGLALAMLILFASASFSLEAEAAKKKKNSDEDKETATSYRPSGSIPGTSLTYENLFINDKGIVTVTIYNPTSTGVSFTSKFSFYDDKGNYMTGFSIKGFSNAGVREAHFLELSDYKKFKKATRMKVLGRSGRSVE